MSGPNIQMPTSLTEMLGPDGSVKPEWAAFIASLAAVALGCTRSGSTSARPTSELQRYVGMPYFDQSLGKPVFLKFTSSNIWVDGSGAVV